MIDSYTKYKHWLWWAFLIGSLGIVVSLASCSESKKIEKAYERVGIYEPQSAKDSAIIRKRAVGIIKTPKPTVQPGHTIKVPYPVEKLKKVLDSATLQHIIDSLEIAHANDLNNTVDDCMESVKKARKEGIAAGYAKAQYEDYINGKDSMTPEIHFYPDTSIVIQLDETKGQLRSVQDQLIKAKAQDEIHKGEARNRLFVIFGLIAVLCLGVYLTFKKKTNPVSVVDKLKNII